MLPILVFFLTVTSSTNSKTRFLNTHVSFPDFLAEPPSHDLSCLSLCLRNGMLNMHRDCWYLRVDQALSNASDAWSSFVFFCPPFSSYSKGGPLYSTILSNRSCSLSRQDLPYHTFLIFCCSYNSCFQFFSTLFSLLQ